MFKETFTAGQAIIRYGDIGKDYYLLSRGKVKVTVYKPGTNPFDPKISEKIDFEKVLDSSTSDNMIGFGEIALLYNDKRSA